MSKKKKFKKTVNNAPSDKYLDDLYREVCLTRDGWMCRYMKEKHSAVMTRENANLEVHHIMKKTTRRLRWNLSNGITITEKSHKNIAHNQDPTIKNSFRLWALKRLTKTQREGLEKLERLRETGGVNKFTVKEYLKLKLKTYQLAG